MRKIIRMLILVFITIAVFAAILLLLENTKERDGLQQQLTEAIVFLETTESEIIKSEISGSEVIESEKVETEEEVGAEQLQDARVTEVASMKNFSAGEIVAESMIELEFIDQLFFAGAINEEVLARIHGKSYTENENIDLTDLSYLKMLYYGFDGNTYVGEMIVNQKIESEVLDIFKTLYEKQYPIEKMVLVDQYDASDELSMEDNNTSAFNYRTISGSSKLSNHSYGMAIDLNPKYNPYVKKSSDGTILCQPESGREYADRSGEFAYKIDENDLAYQLFTQAGFTWGGNWNSVKDYQHFEKEE